VWDPDAPVTDDFRAQWLPVPGNAGGAPSGLPGESSSFRAQWALFLAHVVTGAPYRHDFLEGAKGVQLAELGVASWRAGRKLDVHPLQA
jgi:predicted dehydrogenase